MIVHEVKYETRVAGVRG